MNIQNSTSSRVWENERECSLGASKALQWSWSQDYRDHMHPVNCWVVHTGIRHPKPLSNAQYGNPSGRYLQTRSVAPMVSYLRVTVLFSFRSPCLLSISFFRHMDCWYQYFNFKCFSWPGLKFTFDGLSRHSGRWVSAMQFNRKSFSKLK